MDSKADEFKRRIELRKTFKKGVRAYHEWLLNQGHLSNKDEYDRQLILRFLEDSAELSRGEFQMPLCDVDGCMNPSVECQYTLSGSWCRCADHRGEEL